MERPGEERVAGRAADVGGHALLAERLPADAILCNGAGNYSIWVHRFHRFRAFGTQLAPTSGSMGYGTPGRRRCQGGASVTAPSSRSPATAAS